MKAKMKAKMNTKMKITAKSFKFFIFSILFIIGLITVAGDGKYMPFFNIGGLILLFISCAVLRSID